MKTASIASAILALIVVVALSPVFLRPFVTSSESQDSFFFLRFVNGNEAGLGPNPFVARRATFEGMEPYSHWTNGFYFLIHLIFRVFNAGTLVAQTFIMRIAALAATVVGGYVLVAALKPKYPIMYFAVPLILLTNIGRDAGSFIWRDFLFTSIGFFFAVRMHERRAFLYAFRTLIFALPFFYDLAAVPIAVFIAADFLIHKDKKSFFINLGIWSASVALVFLALLLGFGDVARGWDELVFAVKTRSIAPGLLIEKDPTLAFPIFFRLLLRRLHDAFNLGLWGIVLAGIGGAYMIRNKDWWYFSLLASWFVFAVAFRGAIFPNYYSYFGWVFYALLFLLYGAANITKELAHRISWLQKYLAPVSAVGIAILALNVYLVPTVYPVKDRIHDALLAPPAYPKDPIADMSRIVYLLDSPASRARLKKLGCNSFVWEQTPRTDELLPQLSLAALGSYVTEGMRRNEPRVQCRIKVDGRHIVSIERT